MSTDPLKSGDTPLTMNVLREMAAGVDTIRTLARITELEATVKALSDKIDRLNQWTANIPQIEKDVEKNTKDLNALGVRLGGDIGKLDQFKLRAEGIGIAVGTLITGGLLSALALHFFK
jgi:hypothetical protein